MRAEKKSKGEASVEVEVQGREGMLLSRPPQTLFAGFFLRGESAHFLTLATTSAIRLPRDRLFSGAGSWYEGGRGHGQETAKSVAKDAKAETAELRASLRESPPALGAAAATVETGDRRASTATDRA